MAAMQVMSVAPHQLAPFADRHADDAVAAVLLAGDHEPHVDTVQLTHLRVYLLISCFLLCDL